MLFQMCGYLQPNIGPRFWSSGDDDDDDDDDESESEYGNNM